MIFVIRFSWVVSFAVDVLYYDHLRLIRPIVLRVPDSTLPTWTTVYAIIHRPIDQSDTIA
ncbi:MAG TPA: hypothetical protein ENH10_01885 [Bacteroidetes bacterium]|nr:hypothetical protein [Bacteroidota bacterium]HEX03892.1 hypothetical protein [Bacteroidota bacterium]